MIFEIELSNIYDTRCLNAVVIDLPATWIELNDALQKARIPDEQAAYKVSILDSEPECLTQIMPDNINLYELNYLAQRLAEMPDLGINAFEGLMMMDIVRTGYAPIPVERLINMTHSLEDCHVIYEVFDDKTLGEFYAENSFITELDDLSDKVFNWLDCEKIGKYMRESEGGVFTSCGYVVQTGAMSCEYSFDTANFEQKPDYVFLLEIGEAPENNYPSDMSCATLKLPASIDDITKALAEVNCSSLQDCVFYRFDSLVPSLSYIFESMDDFKELNNLAQEIKALNENGNLQKFKSLLEATKCKDMVTATELAQDLDLYTFNSKMLSSSAYAKATLEMLNIPIKQRFFDSVSLDTYALELMEHDNVHSTCYGLISRNNHEPIMSQQQNNSTMTMQ